MLAFIVEAFRTLTDVNLFTGLVTAGLVFTAYALIKAMTGSLFLGTIFLPFLALGGLAGNYVFESHFVTVLNDKDADTVLAVGCGVLAAMIVISTVAKITGCILEWRFLRNRRPEQFVAAELFAKTNQAG